MNIFTKSSEWWLNICILSISILIGVYIYMHIRIGGQEMRELNKDQLNTINSIINDTIKTFFIKENVKYYLKSNIPVIDSNKIDTLIDRYDTKILNMVLSKQLFLSKSTFWLSGPLVYLECLFWTLFGVLANILYQISDLMSKKEFKKGLKYIQITKIFYSPLITIVIVLGANLLSSNFNDLAEKNTSWIIVLSFILGFFSRRALELLNKLKDVILPLGKESPTEIEPVEEKKYQISGNLVFDTTITEPPKEKLPNASIYLKSMNYLEPEEVTHPDKDGKFEFKEVSEGEYLIEAELLNNTMFFKGSNTFKLSVDKEKEPVVVVLKESQIKVR